MLQVEFDFAEKDLRLKLRVGSDENPDVGVANDLEYRSYDGEND